MYFQGGDLPSAAPAPLEKKEKTAAAALPLRLPAAVPALVERKDALHDGSSIAASAPPAQSLKAAAPPPSASSAPIPSEDALLEKVKDLDIGLRVSKANINNALELIKLVKAVCVGSARDFGFSLPPSHFSSHLLMTRLSSPRRQHHYDSVAFKAAKALKRTFDDFKGTVPLSLKPKGSSALQYSSFFPLIFAVLRSFYHS